MKQTITLFLSVLSSMAAAVPLEKRIAYTTTVIEDVTDIVDVYTTVYVSPGDPRLTLNQQPAVQTPSSAPVVSVTPIVSTSPVMPSFLPQTTSQAPAVAPQQKLEAYVQEPTPTSTPAPSTTPQVVAQPEIEAAAPAPVDPVSSVAPVQPSATPAPSQSVPSGSTSGSGPSGGACGTVNGKCTAGDVTTFDGSGGAGACGYIDPDKTPDYVALAVGMMGPQSNGGGTMNPYCNRQITISNNGQTYPAMITDKCPGCAGGDQSLDLSPTLFAKIFDGATTGNFHDIEWWFTS